jgi:hypothetical protein
MKRLRWMIGWLLAGLLLLQDAASGLAASETSNPLEGHLLRHSGGAMYVFHAGSKFAVSLVDLGDQVIDAIPTASSRQWDSLFASTPDGATNSPPVSPEPVPGYS